VLILSESIEENLQILKEVLILLKQYGFQLNYNKCQFLKKQVEFLGYIVSSTGITLSPCHTDVVRQYRQPSNIVETQRFLGLVSYFRIFIRDFAAMAKSLYNLLKKNVTFRFDDECVQSFNVIVTKTGSHRAWY